MRVRTMQRRRAAGGLAALLAGALSLAACGGGDEQTASPGGDPDEIEHPELAVGVTPSLTFAQVFYADAEGIFDEHGLDVELVPKGSSDVPPLLAGEYQIGTMAGATYIQALAEGFPLRALYPGVEGHTGAISIMTMPGSGIEALDDLDGAAVAINQPGAAFEIFTRILLEDAGVGQDSVEFTTIPFSSMVEALVGGQVDAAVLTAPYNTIAEDQGAALAVDPFDGPLDGAPIAGFTVTEEFAGQNPNTVEAFVAAMDEAVERLNALTDEEYAAFLPTFTSVEADVAARVVRPEYTTRVDVEQTQALADVMADIGAIREEVDIEAAVVDVESP